MSKRKLPRRELPWIGTLLDDLPFSRLPTNSSVLKRLLFLVEAGVNGQTTIDAAAHTVKNELIQIWTYAGYEDILHDPSFIHKKIRDLNISYKSLNKISISRRSTPSFLQKEASFLESLSKLFDITVKAEHYSNKITKEDRDFLLNHWWKPISSTPDLKLKKTVLKKLERQEQHQTYLSQDPQPSTSSSQPSSTPSPDAAPSPPSDPEFAPKRSCTTPRSTGTTLHLPRDILKRVGPTADRLGLTNNQLTVMTAVITNHGGGDIDDLALSKSTTRRSRITARAAGADDIRGSLECEVGQVNFDGKLLKDLGGMEKVNRLAVVLVQEEENQMLGLIHTEDSTGKVEAEAVRTTLDSWSVTEKIVACGFDTTASNTGVHKGACTILQELLQRQLLWLACRHHILELVLKATFQELFGNTTGPEESFFKFLKPSWESLDLNDITLPKIPPSLKAEVPEVLSFINNCLQPENSTLLPRDDYREFLELAKMILGAYVERKRGTYSLHRPGADHHARWMSKALYTLKVTLLLPQITSLPWYRKKQLEKMSFFIIFVYLRSWFTAPLLYSAGASDLDLFNRIRKFSKIHKKMAGVAEGVLQRHTWYLTEELIPLCLFNSNLPEETLNNLAQRISELPEEQPAIQKPILPDLTPSSTITDFVGPRSTVFFNILGVPHSFLKNSDWRTSSDFQQIRRALKNLTPLNDSCERALALATTFNGKITKDEASFQDLLLVVEAHRKKFNLQKKKDLKKLF